MFKQICQRYSLSNVKKGIPLQDLQQSLLTEEYFGQYPALTQLWHGFPGLSVQTGGLVGWTPSIKSRGIAKITAWALLSSIKNDTS